MTENASKMSIHSKCIAFAEKVFYLSNVKSIGHAGKHSFCKNIQEVISWKFLKSFPQLHSR